MRRTPRCDGFCLCRLFSHRDLARHCQARKECSQELWEAPAKLTPLVGLTGTLALQVGTDGAAELNDWSFGQLCRLAGIHKETVNRLSADTAQRVLSETLPHGTKPFQLLKTDGVLPASLCEPL